VKAQGDGVNKGMNATLFSPGAAAEQEQDPVLVLTAGSSAVGLGSEQQERLAVPRRPNHERVAQSLSTSSVMLGCVLGVQWGLFGGGQAWTECARHRRAQPPIRFYPT